MSLHPVIEKILFTEKQLDNKAKELAKNISEYYKKINNNKPVVLLGLLKGCVPFMANLMRHMTIPVTTEYMVVSSYGNNSVSSKTPQILLDVNQDIFDKHVLVVEDIIDSGNTLDFVQNHLKNRGAKDVKLVTMLNKPDRRETDVKVDWIGENIADYFIVGYGLDYAQRFRNLPYIAKIDLDKFNKYDWENE